MIKLPSCTIYYILSLHKILELLSLKLVRIKEEVLILKKEDKNLIISIIFFIFVDFFSTMIKTYLIYRITIFKTIFYILPQVILIFWLLKNLLNKWITVYLTLLITQLINTIVSLKLILELIK